MKHKSNHIYEVLNETVKILNSVPDLWKQTCDDMRLVDLEMSDILHELELEEISEDKGSELAFEIKDIRQRRRVIKDDQIAFAHLKDFCEKNGTFAKRLEEVVASMNTEIDARSRRIYRPKVRVDKMNAIYAENAVRDDIHQEEEIKFIEAGQIEQIALNL